MTTQFTGIISTSIVFFDDTFKNIFHFQTSQSAQYLQHTSVDGTSHTTLVSIKLYSTTADFVILHAEKELLL